MEIEFKEVTPEMRIIHLDMIGNHEKIIVKEKKIIGIVVVGLIVIWAAALIWQKKNYSKTIARIVEENETKNDLEDQNGVESETKSKSNY